MPPPLPARSHAAPLVLGHRGASADAPENTLSAFGLALEQGADGFELDVWRCGTGEVVVHHDPDTGRTGGRSLRVTRASLAELRRLDVGSWKATRFAGERVPTLREVLGAFPGATVNVELKSAGRPDPRLALAVAAVLRDAGAAERCLVSSFDLALLAAFRLAAPRVACGVLVDAGPRWALRAGAAARLLRPCAIHPQWTLITPRRLARWRARGLAVNAWTVDRPEELGRLALAGVSALITNRPALAREAVREALRCGARRA
jgi:glycerophosphoryl diester phosphodiesterase